MTKDKLIEEVLKEFDKEFGHKNEVCSTKEPCYFDMLKDFIRQALVRVRAETIEEIKTEVESQRTPLSFNGPEPKPNERGFINYSVSGLTLIDLKKVIEYLGKLKGEK